MREQPGDLFDQFKSLAQQDRRSINQEMIEVMHRALQSELLRRQRAAALQGIAEIRRSLPVETLAGQDRLTILREDRQRL
jgi:hypothetical protein